MCATVTAAEKEREKEMNEEARACVLARVCVRACVDLAVINYRLLRCPALFI